MLRILLLTILLCGPATASQLVCDFDIDSLQMPQANYRFAYPELDQLVVNTNLTVPVKTCYFKIDNNFPEPQVTVQVLAGSIIGAISSEAAHFDNAVTDIEKNNRQSPLRCRTRLAQPLLSVEKITTGDNHYLAVTILPISITDNGDIFFNQSLVIDVDAFGAVSCDRDQIISTCRNAVTARHSVAPLASSVEPVPLGYAYVIITTPELDSAFGELALFKNASGLSTAIALTDSIYARYDGIDHAEKIRNYLIDFHEQGGVYVLLGGDDVTVPARYVYYYNTNSYPSDSYELMPSDLYYADLTGQWDLDGDGVWGEPTHDAPDLIPELKVGRLPIRTAEQAGAYITKLKSYLTNPGDGEFSYLAKSMIFAADQMRDYPAEGQHAVIAGAMPAGFEIDTVTGVENPSGADLSPTNASGAESVNMLSEGVGIVHILCHGRVDGFMVRSAGYGESATSYILSPPQGNGQGSLTELAKNNRLSLYYSLACNSGAFDLDTIDAEPTNWSFVERLIAMEDCGAVGLIGYSRWGWVYSSYLLQAAFTRYLSNEADGSPVEAMYYSWMDYPYYRDLIYGQNYYGDPSLKVYLEEPDDLDFNVGHNDNSFVIHANSIKEPVPFAEVILSANGVIIEQGTTDENGNYPVMTALDPDSGYCITAIKDGYTVAHDTYIASMTLDVDDESDLPLPTELSLEQNYPNPFNPGTNIPYALPYRTDVIFTVYNILGQVVDEKQYRDQLAGDYVIVWNGTDGAGNDLPSGIYFYRLRAGNEVRSKKMLLLR